MSQGEDVWGLHLGRGTTRAGLKGPEGQVGIQDSGARSGWGWAGHGSQRWGQRRKRRAGRGG